MHISIEFARYVGVFQRYRALKILYDSLAPCPFVFEWWTHPKNGLWQWILLLNRYLV